MSLASTFQHQNFHIDFAIVYDFIQIKSMKPLIPKKNNDDKPMVLWVWIINSLLDVKLAEMIEWVSSEGDGVFRIKKPKLLSREWTIYKSSFTKKKI